MEPEVLILDEPTAGLDPVGCESILAQIRQYHRAKGNTRLLVSHSMEEIACNAGRIVKAGSETHRDGRRAGGDFFPGRRAGVHRTGRAGGDAHCRGPAPARAANRQRRVYSGEALRAEILRLRGELPRAERHYPRAVFPGNTLAHRLDPRTKLMMVVIYIIALFCAKSFSHMVFWRCSCLSASKFQK